MKNPKKRIKRLPDDIKTVSDDFGNNITCANNGKRVILSLKLVKEARRRRIGVINLERKTLEVKRTKSLHLFRKLNAYGFNHKLLNDSKLFDKVRLLDDFEEWLIPKEFILNNGSFLNFVNKGGFELQIFVPLEKLSDFKKAPKI